MRVIRTSGLTSGDGKRGVAAWPKPPRPSSTLPDAHRAALQARWRLVDLIAWVWEEFRITISKQTLSRELRALGYRKLSARPRHHANNEAAVAAFKKTSRPVWRRSQSRGS